MIMELRIHRAADDSWQKVVKEPLELMGGGMPDNLPLPNRLEMKHVSASSPPPGHFIQLGLKSPLASADREKHIERLQRMTSHMIQTSQLLRMECSGYDLWITGLSADYKLQCVVVPHARAPRPRTEAAPPLERNVRPRIESSETAPPSAEPIESPMVSHLSSLTAAPSGEPVPQLVFPKCPRPGQEGKLITLVTNTVPVRVPRSLVIYQYDVNFWFAHRTNENEQGDKRIPEALAHEVFAKLKLLFGTASTAYDFNKIVYSSTSPEELQNGSGWEADSQGVWATELRSGQKVQVSPSRVSASSDGAHTEVVKLPMDDLIAGKIEGPSFRKFMAAVDVTLSERSVLRCIKSSFYNENDRPHPVLGDYEIWLGYRQTVVDTEGGLMLFVDHAATAMYAPTNLLDFLSKKLNKPRGALKFEDVKGAERKLSQHGTGKPKLNSRHRPNHVYKFFGLDDVPMSEAFFHDKETDSDRKVLDWWAEKHPNTTLREKHLPMVCVSTKGTRSSPKDPKTVIRLPIELCSWAGGEPVMESRPELTQAVLAKAALAPAERFPRIHGIVGGKSERMGGISTGKELTEVKARQLRPLDLVYFDNQSKRSVTVRVDHSGNHNLAQGGYDLGFMRAGQKRRSGESENIRNFVVINFEPRRFNQRHVDDFLNLWMRLARERGIHLEKPYIIDDGSRILSSFSVEDKLNEMHAQNPIGLVLCFLPESQAQNRGYLYPALKRWSETGTGVPLSCVNTGKLLKEGKRGNSVTDPSYHAGILLKLNLKLGGTNGHAKDGLKLMRDQPTMVCGVDVHHGRPGSDARSWAALVASTDEYCTEYYTTVTSQAPRKEILENLEDNMIHCVRHFSEVNGCPPRRIIFYRDGVAHNQFQQVAQVEIAAIHRALQQMDLMAELIFIVVQKKTNIRFGMHGGHMPGKGKGKGKGKGGGRGDFGSREPQGGLGQLGQAPPGTVVDTQITDRDLFDFYMVSQHSGLGTARPAHYHVLQCPHSLTQDEIQRFTFDLCHVYARCTKIASLPAPVAYAHLAAFHAPWYAADYRESADDLWERCSTSSKGSGTSRVSQYAPINETQRRRLYYA